MYLRTRPGKFQDAVGKAAAYADGLQRQNTLTLQGFGSLAVTNVLSGKVWRVPKAPKQVNGMWWSIAFAEADATFLI